MKPTRALEHDSDVAGPRRFPLVLSTTFSALGLLGLGGCEPADLPVDVLTETGTESSGDGDGDPASGDGDGDPASGDGDGDPASGDGDGDPGGDGDGDTTGDGDGDPGGDGDGDTTGDGDGDPGGDGDGDPGGDGDGDPGGDGDGDPGGDGDGDLGGDGDGDFDPNQDFDPLCGDWTSIKTRGYGLDHVWTDGTDIIAAGSGDVVKRGQGPWVDVDAATSDRFMSSVFDVWGPSVDDHWITANVSGLGPSVHHFDGQAFTTVVEFPEPNILGDYGFLVPQSLAGSAPDDIWAAALADCNSFDCSEDPDCECNTHPSILIHYDGVEWQQVESPGLVRELWTDGASTWAVGGRDDSPWLTPSGSLVAHHDGVEWTVLLDGELPALHTVWAMNDDEVWVGGEQGTLRRLEFGDWQVFDLPTPNTVIRVDGRASNEVWALVEGGDLWTFDGQAWSLLLEIPEARDFAALEDGLVAVGYDSGQWIAEIDTVNETLDPVYTREGRFWPGTMVADSRVDAVASYVLSGESTLPVDSGSMRRNGSTWVPTYEDHEPGFHRLQGSVDQGFGTLMFFEDNFLDYTELYAIDDGVISQLALPDPQEVVRAAERMILGGEEQLWISGREPAPFIRAYVGGQWIALPNLPDGRSVRHFSAGGEQVFAFTDWPHDDIWVFEDGAWAQLPPAPDDSDARSFVATGPDELWMTNYIDQDTGYQLHMWDGQQWHYGPDLWPLLDGHRDWWTLRRAPEGGLWMLSDRFFEPEELAYWDGQDWTILDTPPLLHGWSTRQNLLLEPTSGGDALFVHDGIRLWRYAYCPV